AGHGKAFARYRKCRCRGKIYRSARQAWLADDAVRALPDSAGKQQLSICFAFAMQAAGQRTELRFGRKRATGIPAALPGSEVKRKEEGFFSMWKPTNQPSTGPAMPEPQRTPMTPAPSEPARTAAPATHSQPQEQASIGKSLVIK